MSASKLGNARKCCAGCNREIRERHLLKAMDKYWHTTCLKCSQCGAILEQVGDSCFVKGTSILCRNDYMRLYGGPARALCTCATCGKQIPASDKVLRAGQNVYHVTCFVCTTCKRQLKTGDKYCVIDSKLFCEQDALANEQEKHKVNNTK
ncbi:spinal cord association neuron differentiation [Desmophyllum pertusum]|uniref:Spinal cord association neuron differentiation n=1 Tax=Desmophyllum pertusum TaxID=174260 RepID=A0A9X0CVZ7_9CNID|nr:spinal cord association neuron differentiation [Desmophyllum pertusum]